MPELLPLVKIAEGYLEACEDMGVDAEELVKLGQALLPHLDPNRPATDYPKLKLPGPTLTPTQQKYPMQGSPYSPGKMKARRQKYQAGVARQEQSFGPGFEEWQSKWRAAPAGPAAARTTAQLQAWAKQEREKRLYGRQQPGGQPAVAKPAITPVAPPGGVVRPGILANIQKAGPTAQRQFLAWMKQQPPEEQKRLWAEYKKLTPAHLGSTYARTRRKAQQAGTSPEAAVTGTPAALSAAAPGIGKLTPEQLRTGVAPTTSAGRTPEQRLKRYELLRQELVREQRQLPARLDQPPRGEYGQERWGPYIVRKMKKDLPGWIHRGYKTQEQAAADYAAADAAAKAEVTAKTDVTEGERKAKLYRETREQYEARKPGMFRREQAVAEGKAVKPVPTDPKEQYAEQKTYNSWLELVRPQMIEADKGNPGNTARRLNMAVPDIWLRHEYAQKHPGGGRGGFRPGPRRRIQALRSATHPNTIRWDYPG